MELVRSFNVMTFPELGVNYFGIPKCMNTSIKWALLNEVGLADQPIDEISKWVHNVELDRYITPEDALSSPLRNFTVIRSPYDRVRSLYKDFGCGRRTSLNISIDSFMRKLWSENIHYLPMSDFIPVGVDVLRFDEVADYLGIDIPRLNCTDSADVVLTDEHKRLIRERYGEDFKRWH